MIGTKIAAIFGAEIPDTVTSPISVIPMSSRVRRYEDYLRAKSQEDSTHPGKAALIGGLLTGLPTGLLIGSNSGARAGLVGGGLAGALGAGMGYLIAAHDEDTIADAKNTLRDARRNKNVLTQRIEDAIEAQRSYEEGAREYAADRRTDRIVSSNSGRRAVSDHLHLSTGPRGTFMSSTTRTTPGRF